MSLDVKYDSEKLEKESQEFIDKFKVKIKSVIDETLGELYVNIMPYCNSDTRLNYREALRIELEHEYKFSNFKNEWATNFRRAVFVENREEISKLIEQDILKRNKHLEDCSQEFEMFRYSPTGDRYQDKVKRITELEKENARLKEENTKLRKQLNIAVDVLVSMRAMSRDYTLHTPWAAQTLEKMKAIGYLELLGNEPLHDRQD